MTKMLHLPVYVTVLKIYIKFPKWLYVLNYYSDSTGIFIPDAEMNDEDDVNLPFIIFLSLQNTSSCYF